MFENIRKLDVAIYIFLITIIGYSMTYTYELGVKHYYSIPVSFIELNLTSLTRNSLSVSILIFIGLFLQLFVTKTDLYQFISNLVPSKQTSIKRKLGTWWIVGLMIVCILWSINYINSPEIYFSILFFVTGYCAAKHYFPLAFLFLILLLFSLIYSSGYNHAEKKVTYLKIANQDLVVLDYYRDNAVTAKVNIEEKTISPEFQFIPLNSKDKNNNNIKFELVHTGKLKVGKIKDIKKDH